ncbi:MAG TPA: lasso peptide biosynthesis B2 protein [Nitrospiraceae bacterium]|nr:lasso peptide biosynthesis B2 protein [Nitrospiraceae bacterium]
MENQSDTPYFLSRAAHLCVLNDRVVLLNVVSGKYFSLDSAAAASLNGRVCGWPQLEGPGNGSDALASLMRQGLVTSDARQGKPAVPVQIRLPTGWLCESVPRGCPDIDALHILRFIKAATWAMASLRFLKLQSIMRRISSRKAAQPRLVADPAVIVELIRVFDWLRPLAFEKKNGCFVYCLAILEFLACYGVFPDWVFAVKDRPFRAHCWLQQGELLFTDIPFEVRQLTPIMVA